MPELPEVETMVRGLRTAVEGGTLGPVDVLDEHLLEDGLRADVLAKTLSGAKVRKLDRRGKWVLWELGDDRGTVIIQPRMTGVFLLEEPQRREHVRVRFRIAASPRDAKTSGSGDSIWFSDSRRLARIRWCADRASAERVCGASQGPDALLIGLDDLFDRLGRTHRSIKPALLDQKILAGVGNIYADESLHEAQIHPERPADELTRADAARLREAILKVLNEAIRAEGSSFDAGYRTVLGAEGGYLRDCARAYGRAGLPCRRCQQPIVRTKISGLIGRSTYYCPHCQTKPIVTNP